MAGFPSWENMRVNSPGSDDRACACCDRTLDCTDPAAGGFAAGLPGLLTGASRLQKCSGGGGAADLTG